MRKILMVVMACASVAMAQNVVTLQAQQPYETKHSLWQSTYDLTLASTSNIIIMVAAGAQAVTYGVNIDFTEPTLASTDIDVRIYRQPWFTNYGLTATTNGTNSPTHWSRYWIPTTTNFTLNSPTPDPADLCNIPAWPVIQQPVGTWARNMTGAGFASYFTEMSNIGTQDASYYFAAAAAGTRVTRSLPAPYTLRPNYQDLIVMSNRTAAASNAVMRVVITSYLPH